MVGVQRLPVAHFDSLEQLTATVARMGLVRKIHQLHMNLALAPVDEISPLQQDHHHHSRGHQPLPASWQGIVGASFPRPHRASIWSKTLTRAAAPL